MEWMRRMEWGGWNVSSADKMGMGLLYNHVASRQPRSRYNDSILKLICSHLQHSYIFWLNLNVIVISMTLNMVQYIPSVWFHSFPRYPTLHVISSFMSPSNLVFYHFLMSLQAWHWLLYQINFIFTFLNGSDFLVFASPTILILSFLINHLNLDSPYHYDDHHLKWCLCYASLYLM